MKEFVIEKDKDKITLKYDDKTSKYDAMLFVIGELGRYLQNKGREEELQSLLNALTSRNETIKELEELYEEKKEDIL